VSRGTELGSGRAQPHMASGKSKNHPPKHKNTIISVTIIIINKYYCNCCFYVQSICSKFSMGLIISHWSFLSPVANFSGLNHLISHHCASPKRIPTCTMLNNWSRLNTKLPGKLQLGEVWVLAPSLSPIARPEDTTRENMGLIL